MEGGNKNNSNFIRYCMKGIMDGLGPSKELFNLIKFDGSKMVQVVGELIEVYCQKITCMLHTLHCGNTCFIDIENMEFENILIR